MLKLLKGHHFDSDLLISHLLLHFFNIQGQGSVFIDVVESPFDECVEDAASLPWDDGITELQAMDVLSHILHWQTRLLKLVQKLAEEVTADCAEEQRGILLKKIQHAVVEGLDAALIGSVFCS